jgi:hypothetical protein
MDFLLKIEAYINGQLSYQEAVDIYNQIGKNSALKTIFSTGEDSYSRKKLKAEFKAILDAQKPTFEIHSQPKKKASIDVSKLPSHLKKEYYKLAPIIREIAATNPTLIYLPDDKARFESAKRIIELVDARREIYARLDYFVEHGVDHPLYANTHEVENTDENQLSYYQAQYELKLARSQRSKLKGNKKRLGDYDAICKRITELEKIVEIGK